MVKINKRVCMAFLLTILLIQVSATVQTAAQGNDGLTLAIRESLQETGKVLKITDDAHRRLTVAAARTVQVSDLGFLAYAVKVLDTRTDTVYSYWYDERMEPISEEAAFHTRATAYEARYGRLSRGLYDRLHYPGMSAQDNIPVAIWAEQSVGGDWGSVGPYKVYLPLVASSDSKTPVEQIVQFLAQRGYAADYVSTQAPIVYASLPSAVILELQSQGYVAAVYEQSESYLTLDSAARTSAAPWTWERGITGAGIKVAILEDDGVAFDNPYINGSQYHIGWSKRIGSHATRVAGVIASDHSNYRGIAYGAEILSANALTLLFEWPVVWATDWAIGAGADVINASFGTVCQGRDITSEDKYFDWVVWDRRKTVVISAGNLRSGCTGNYNVSSPGKAYNVITVGSKDDKNTATTEPDTKDDQFSSFSLYVDPVTASENRLKPEVVAVGECIRTTSTADPWIESGEVQGTSYSAPIVAGEAALMMQRAGWLKYSPEAVKAGIMASAKWTYLHDDVNWNQWTSIDKMGVGAIDTTAADNSLINNRVQELYLHQSDFSDNHYDISFDGLGGQRIRVVIVWSSHPSRIRILNWILHDRLESDFDLTILAPNGQIFGSYADEANYEIVEFVAPQTGTHRARIHLSRWDNSSMEERIGFAWYSGFPLP